MNSSTSLRNLEKIFITYSDVTNKSIISNINNKLSVVTEKITFEYEEKFREKEALNVIIFNVPECTNTTSFNSVKNAKKDLIKIH